MVLTTRLYYHDATIEGLRYDHAAVAVSRICKREHQIPGAVGMTVGRNARGSRDLTPRTFRSAVWKWNGQLVSRFFLNLHGVL